MYDAGGGIYHQALRESILSRSIGEAICQSALQAGRAVPVTSKFVRKPELTGLATQRSR